MVARLRAGFASLRDRLFGSRRERTRLFAFLALVVVAGILLTHPVFAQTTDPAAGNDIYHSLGLLLGNFLLGLIKWAGTLLLFLINILLIPVATYNGFVTSPPVERGWTIVRDLTNMFFVLMMLVISIGTILGVEEFSYRKLLPRLLIMAVLINFSKVIVGLFIDFSQVIMLTFVNGFSAAAGGNMIQLLQLKEAVTVSDNIPANYVANIWDFVGAQLLALIMILISMMIVVIMFMMLAFRIVMLWILTILSPLAFFLSTFPRGKAQQAYGEWWSKLGNYLISGPLLAFFLWLAFSVTASGGLNIGVESTVQETSNQFFATEAGSTDSMTSFVIGIALLLGGMYVTADLGVAGGNMLRGGADWVKNAGQKLAKGAALLPLRAGLAAGGVGLRYGERKFYAATGVGLAPSRYTQAFKDWRKGVAERDELAGRGVAARRAAAGGRLAPLAALAGSPQDFFENYMSWKGMKMGARQILRGDVQGQLDKAAGRRERAEELLGEAAGARERGEAAASGAAGLSTRLGTGTVTSSDLRAALPDIIAAAQARLGDLKAQGGAAVSRGDTAGAERIGGQVQGEERLLEDLEAWRRKDRDEEFEQEYDVGLGSFGRSADGIRQGLYGRVAGLQGDAAGYAENARLLDAKAAKAEREAAAAGARAGGLRAPARFAEAALAKQLSEEKEKLPKSMTGTDRLDQVEDAVRGGNFQKFRLMLSKMADEEEFSDLLQDGKMWGGRKFGTDTAGLKAFAEEIKGRFNVDEQETLRTLNEAFGTLIGKGQSSFLGRLAQDRGTGALRWNSSAGHANAHAGKLDKQNDNELFGKDRVNAVFEVRMAADGTSQTGLTEAGLAKVIASQDKLGKMLQENKVHPKMLEALKKNEERLADAVRRQLIKPEFMEKLANATVRKISTAKETLGRMRRV